MSEIIKHEPSLDRLKELLQMVKTMRSVIFVSGIDFGPIPGTNDKPVLLLPGMEKLLRGLRLTPQYIPLTVIEDFEKPLFIYRYECRLIDEEGGVVGAAIGSANSYESKWRWRDAKRICPHCKKETIIKGKAEYGGGWICFAKKGGCGAKFRDGDESIEAQAVGRVENTDIFDQVNTIDKIAQKRALGSAIKGAAAVSEFFTVDLEDMPSFNVQVQEEAELKQIPGTVVIPDDKPWTKEQQETFWNHCITVKALTQTNIFAALNIKKGLGEWKKGDRAAYEAVNAWLNGQTSSAGK